MQKLNKLQTLFAAGAVVVVALLVGTVVYTRSKPSAPEANTIVIEPVKQETTVPKAPELEQDETVKVTAEFASCEAGWGGFVQGLNRSDKKSLSEIEKCMSILNYPFKKFSIPGTSSYYGFMGNYGSAWIEGDSRNDIWCQIDGLNNACMLYKVENGIPTIIENSDHPIGSELTQLRILRAERDGSLLVHRFPYEIIYFQDFYSYDFVNGTTTSHVVNFSGGGDWGEEGFVSSTLTFYPNGKTIKFVVDNRQSEGDWNAPTTLIYKGTSLLSFKESEEDIFRDGLFPRVTELRAYALQSDKTKFYFTAASSSYTLDLAPAIPKLIKR